MNPVEECRRKAEDMLQFFAMTAADQIAFLGNLPHDHGHPQFLQNSQVIRFQRLVDNFLESDPSMVAAGGGESGIERDMQYLLNRELGEGHSMMLWSEQGVQRHAIWRILRILAREALIRAGAQPTSPSVRVDELCSR